MLLLMDNETKMAKATQNGISAWRWRRTNGM